VEERAQRRAALSKGGSILVNERKKERWGKAVRKKKQETDYKLITREKKTKAHTQKQKWRKVHRRENRGKKGPIAKHKKEKKGKRKQERR